MLSCPFEQVRVQELAKHIDHRGWLIELFRQDELEGQPTPAMGYISGTSPGGVRGPHEHRRQTDRFVFIGPSPMRLYMWDNRKQSSTYGQFWEADLGDVTTAAITVPPGIVHAYRNMGKEISLVLNFPDRLFRGEGRSEEPDEIRHETDPDSPFVIPDYDARADQRSY